MIRRREFIKITALTGIGLSLPNGLMQMAGSASVATKVDLALASGNSPEKITRAAIDALGGIGKFISRGDIVVVKPNMAWDRTPEQAGNTNPEVVATVVKLCFEAGAKKVRVLTLARANYL